MGSETYRRYKYKRRYQWSAPIAYSVGLMASDGCLSKDGRHIDLTSVDVEQLENFCVAIGRSVPISKKTSRELGGHQAYRVQFSDAAYYDFLLNAGLTPNKSKTLGGVPVPDLYWPDFLRGIFDGDGSCYGYYDKRWRSSFMFYITFTGASFEFLEFISENNQKLFGASRGTLRKGKGVYILSYAKQDSCLLAGYLYKNDNEPCLSRKKVKLQGFIKESNNAIIACNARVVKLVYT